MSLSSTVRMEAMDRVPSLLWSLIFTPLAGILLWRLIRFSVKRRSLPPGPLPWPVLGNIPHLASTPQAGLHQTLAKLAERYGPLLYLELGSRPTLVVSSPKLAEEVLKTQDAIWCARGHFSSGEIMFYDSHDITFGQRWRFYRAVMMQEFMTVKRLEDYKESRKQEILGNISLSLKRIADGAPSVNMAAVFRTIMLNIVTRMLMNEDLVDLSEDASAYKNQEFVEAMRECFYLVGRLCLGDFVPWLARFDIGGYRKRMRIVSKKMDKFFHEVLENQKQKPKHSGRVQGQDAIDGMLSVKTDVDGQKFEDFEIKALVQEILSAGTDTSSNTIEWAMSELMKNPSLMDRAQAELDSAVGRERLVEESDLPKLPFLQAVVKETFRLHPVAPIMLPHESIDTSVIQGYTLPAKTQLFVNVYAIQRDPSVWDRPTEFNPDRFLNSQKDIHGQNFDLLPFGSGRRICPGKRLALLQVQYPLALMVQTCDWKLPGTLTPDQLDMREFMGMTMSRFSPSGSCAHPQTSPSPPTKPSCLVQNIMVLM